MTRKSIVRDTLEDHSNGSTLWRLHANITTRFFIHITIAIFWVPLTFLMRYYVAQVPHNLHTQCADKAEGKTSSLEFCFEIL